MRLINARTVCLEEFSGNCIPPYAILSHTWETEEVSHQDMQSRNAEQKLGYQKIKLSCLQAVNDGLDYVWVDTCCIDKTSSSELSEAINSMFRWYQDGQVCYAYLSDVHTIHNPEKAGSSFTKSRWFTRGWTLQELIAPANVQFYTKDWEDIGTKEELSTTIEIITGIGSGFLCGQDLRTASIAKRMSWASGRKTTREEDVAYCLLGIFGINIPMIYGEGNRAFIRLQEEIMRESDDQTLFAWGPSSNAPMLGDSQPRSTSNWSPNETSEINLGVLATSPSAFAMSGNVVSSYNPEGEDPHAMTSRGIRITLHISAKFEYALLDCHLESDFQNYLAIPLKPVALGQIEFARSSTAMLEVPVAQRKVLPIRTVYLKKSSEPKSYTPSRRNKFLLENWDRVTGGFLSRGLERSSVASLVAVYPKDCFNRTQAVISPAQWKYNGMRRAVAEIRVDGREVAVLMHQENFSSGSGGLTAWCHVAFKPRDMSLEQLWNQDSPKQPKKALKLYESESASLVSEARWWGGLILSANLEKDFVMGEEMFLVTIKVIFDAVDTVKRSLGRGSSSIKPTHLLRFSVFGLNPS